MSILTFGTEMGFFVPSDANTIESTSLVGDEIESYDTGFSRCATRMSTASSTYGETPNIGSGLTNAWIHFRMERGEGGGGGDLPVFYWKDNAGTDRVRLTTTETDTWKLWHDIGAGWVQIGSSFSADISVGQTVDLNYPCNSASANVRLFLSGTERLSATVVTTAVAQLNKARWHATSSAFAVRTNISEVVIADESTIGMRVMTMYPSGAGADNAWVGAYTDIDEAVYSDADVVTSATANEVKTFAGTTIGSLTGLNIRAVCVTARARRGVTGPQNLQLCIRSGVTNYFSATKTLDVAYGNIFNVWETDPNTAVAWTAANAAAIQFGVKSIA